MMKFEHDIFISYAHIDNMPVGNEKWIETFHERLKTVLAQKLGEIPAIWRDPKLQGNDYFDDAIINQLPGTALLVSVVSPRYVESDWCIDELQKFLQVADQTGGLRVGDKSRIFKVVKTPVDLNEQPAEVQGMLGYEFYKVDPQTGRPREFSQRFGDDAERQYWAKLDDLAYDIRDLLKTMKQQENGSGTHASSSGLSVYLAPTTSDLKEPYDQIRRELHRRGHTVLPNHSLPMNGPELERSMREDLDACTLSIHLIGEKYGLVPEDTDHSVVELQYDVAVGFGKNDLGQVIWIPPDLRISDERQQAFVERLKRDPGNADLLQTPLEDLKTFLQDKLDPPAPPPPPETLPDDRPPHIYLIFHPNDQDAIVPLDDYFYDQEFEVKTAFHDPNGELNQSYHEKMLEQCETLLLYYDQAPPIWVETTLSDLSNVSDISRKNTAVYIAGEETREKARFRTRAFDEVIKNFGDFSADALAPIMIKIQTPGGGTGS